MMRAAVLLIGMFTAASPAMESFDLSGDGWHSWRIATHDSTHERCCANWNSGRSEPINCRLDERSGGFNISDRLDTALGEMQVYALLKDGVPVKVRALSPDCPVRTATPIQDLGLVDSAVSFAWLREFATPHSDISPDVLTAIAMHEGSAPRDELEHVALHDEDPDNREAAVFAISQLPVDQAVDMLIEVVEQHGLDLHTRRSALFWLAQSKSDRVLDYFSNLLAAK